MGRKEPLAEVHKNREVGEMNYVGNRDGFIKPFIVILILAAAVYTGWEFGMPYYRYTAFESSAEDIARLGLGNAEKIRSELFKSAKVYKVPIEEEDITVIKKANTVVVQTEWSVTIDLFGLYQRKLDFKVDFEV